MGSAEEAFSSEDMTHDDEGKDTPPISDRRQPPVRDGRKNTEAGMKRSWSVYRLTRGEKALAKYLINNRIQCKSQRGRGGQMSMENNKNNKI